MLRKWLFHARRYPSENHAGSLFKGGVERGAGNGGAILSLSVCPRNGYFCFPDTARG